MMKHSCCNRYSLMVFVLLMGWFTALSPMVWAESKSGLQTALDLSTAIADVAKKNIPAVVHIDVTQRQEIIAPMLPFGNDPFFRFFFNTPNMNRKYQQEMKGLGSGMIMDAQGHILTNNHVVGNATEIEVLLSNGNKYPGKLIGADPKTDIAVIKIEADTTLPYVNFGDSDEMGVGSWVVAIGHPRGLDQTVTQGIISAKHRRGIMDPNSYQDFLQTDAAINPGNSGGPLLNLQGEVIGVNTAIASQSGGFEGIGFAIPSNMATYVAKGLIEHGKVVRGWLGITTQELTLDLAGSFGLKINKGALIADVVKGSPADKSGLERGDVVIAYGEKQISNMGDLQNEIAATPVGDMVQITVFRKGSKKEISVKIGNLESAAQMMAASLKDLIGAEVRPLDSQDVQQYKLNSTQGVMIIGIDSNGPLGRAGFEERDIILEINGQTVDDLGRFVDLISSLNRNRLIILALDHRTGRTGYVQVELR
jgi:serine protease Do